MDTLQNTTQKKKLIINYLMQHDVLASPELIILLENAEITNKINDLILDKEGFSTINSFIKGLLGSQAAGDETRLTDKSKEPQLSGKRPLAQAIPKLHAALGSQITSKLHQTSESQPTSLPKESTLEIIRDYDLVSMKREVDHFISYFSSRFKLLESILKQRKELSAILSIARLRAKKDRETVSVIGLIKKKDITKNNNIILTLEDLTGETKVLVNKTNQETFNIAKDLVEDEVIGIVGMNGDNILFANDVIQPDIPLDKEYKKSQKEEYAVFLSDIHFGSKYFLKEEFNKFLSWIRQETGTDKHKEMASKVKYIFIVGDIIDGVGIYPGQEDELDISDVYEQYNDAAANLKSIPKDKLIIICPGNHDAVRLSEPQPKLSPKYAKSLYDLSNITMVSNPALINIGSTASFDGFDILLYHGYSFDYYVANVDAIRQEGGYDRADIIMKFLLKRRHLAPTYSSTLFIPEIHSDPLIIDKIPDFFVTGHIHKTSVSNYRNITLICGSCWQSTTSFQTKVGHHPEPARVPVVNLKTRKVTILNFEK